jgi:hypothetical protein
MLSEILSALSSAVSSSNVLSQLRGTSGDNNSSLYSLLATTNDAVDEKLSSLESNNSSSSLSLLGYLFDSND